MECLEEMQTRHRKEQKDLQARVTQKKKGATKKTRKGVNDECAELERQLKERQEQERSASSGEPLPEANIPDLDEATTEAPVESVDGITAKLDSAAISESAPSEEGQPKKRNRQKERLARRAAEQQAAVEEAKKEAANQPDKKALEWKKVLDQVAAKGLTEKLIRPDGHCLFSAVADQLAQLGIPLGVDLKDEERYKAVRASAAGYMEGHPDDFAGFTEEPLHEHVEKIRDTAEWGGHLELIALAKSYQVEICVLQDGDQQVIRPGYGVKEPERIWLAYYRHGFGLGEHYNSLRKAH